MAWHGMALDGEVENISVGFFFEKDTLLSGTCIYGIEPLNISVGFWKRYPALSLVLVYME